MRKWCDIHFPAKHFPSRFTCIDTAVSCYWNVDTCKSESSQRNESSVRQVDSSKAQQQTSSFLIDTERKSLVTQLSKNVGNVPKQKQNLNNWLSKRNAIKQAS